MDFDMTLCTTYRPSKQPFHGETKVDNVAAFKSLSAFDTKSSYPEYTPRGKRAVGGTAVLI